MAKASGGTRQNSGMSYKTNGEPGTYKVYRIGGNQTDSGLIFVSPSFEYSDSYGSTIHHQGKETLEYNVEVKNPLIITLNRDVVKENLYFTESAYRKLVGGNPSSNQLSNDRAIAKALQQSNYDAIMYKGKDGRILEIAIRPNMLGKGKKTKESTYFSRTFGQTKQEFIDEWTQMYISWGNTPQNARRFAIEEAENKEKEWKNR